MIGNYCVAGLFAAAPFPGKQKRFAAAAARRRELAVIGSGIVRRLGVPQLGAVRIAQGLGGATGPIGGARTADRHEHRIVEPGEMAIRRAVVAEEAERDPARQPFRLGETGTLDLAMIGGQTISVGNAAAVERFARQDVPLAPP